jgi:hypothetical protein
MTRRLQWVYVVPLGAGLLVLVALVAAVVLLSRGTAAADEGSGVVADVGGLEYRALDVRLLRPANAGDARMLAGLAHVGSDQVWFGAFLTAQNPTRAPLPMATGFALRDVRGRVYRPVALPAGNPVAYSAQTVAPGAQSPGADTPAQRDLAAEGGLVLFRVPRSSYDAGPLELVIEDPGGAGAAGELFLNS